MANYVSLDEAAKLLGLSSNELIEMRSRGEIFGFRDGTSWKFKSDEIDRVKMELSGDVLSDDPGGSSILVSERPGNSSKSGLVLGGDSEKAKSSSSDLQLDDDILSGASDVALVADPTSGSGVRLVNRTPAPSPADDGDELVLASDEDELEVDASSLSLGPGSGLGLGLGSDLRLADDSKASRGSKSASQTPAPGDSDVIGGSDLKLQSALAGGSPDLAVGGSSGDLDLGDDLKLSDDEDDDLVLGSGSDMALSADSGLNLMSPADSGLSLEDEPLDLEGAGISGLDLGSNVGSDPEIASGSGGGSGAGLSGIDFAATEDFQLSPADGIEVDDDSGSQVIEIEDSTDLGEAFPADGMGLPDDGGFGEGFTEGDVGAGLATGAAAAIPRGIPEVPLAAWEVATLLTTIIVLGISGLLVTDIVRNMWAWNGESDASITSWFTRLIMSSVSMQQ
jgi:hypothetical protein